MLTWKIVEALKVSVLYIYIDERVNLIFILVIIWLIEVLVGS